MNGFGKIVRAHQMQKFMGASLIHKHFPLRDGERIVEEVRQDGTFTAPVHGVSDEAVTPYLWHLTRQDQAFVWTPVEFVVSDTVPLKVRTFADALPGKTAFLRELAEFLTDHEAQNTFGLSMLHRHHVQFDRKTEALLETPGPDDRSLEMRPVIPAMAGIDEWTPTFWNFDIDFEVPTNFCSAHACNPRGHEPRPPSMD